MFKKSIVGLGLVLFSTVASARGADYEVSITNVTVGQTFTPQLIVLHPENYSIFELGEPASLPLEILAEGGDTAPLTEQVAGVAMDVQTVPGLLGPGETVTTVVRGGSWRSAITVAGMMIPTNDTFFALNSIRLTRSSFRPQVYMASAYDAGTEVNDQSCKNMPGPRCGGEGFAEEGGEGYVHIGNGFHDLGDVDDEGNEVLGPMVYDWRNSVARIVVKRLRR